MTTTARILTMALSIFVTSDLTIASLASAAAIPVTSNADAGPGSFRAAVTQANADATIDTITFESGLGTIVLAIANGSVVYEGSQNLAILGASATITSEAGGAFDLFQSIGGGDLTIADLTFSDAGANGITVHVPPTATADLVTVLDHVTVTGSADNGLLIEDQVDESDAGIVLLVEHSTFTGNGTPIADGGNDDRDGIRVDEGGTGDVSAHLVQSTFDGNAYDGVEIDERGEGGVAAVAAHSTFDDNGFGNADDTEDGFDIDEADGGDIVARVVDSSAIGNDDEGFDFSETGEGDLRARFNQAAASANEDEGIKVDETEDGDLDLQVNNSEVSDSDSQDGVEVAESGAGDFRGRFVGSTIAGNDNFGIRASEADAGTGTLQLQSTVIEDNDGDTLLSDVTITKQTP